MLTREVLADEIQDLLQLKGHAYYRYKRKSMQIVNTIINCMKEALLREEEVYIQGFGRFKVRTHPARHRNMAQWHGNTPYQYIKFVPEVKHVGFRAHRALRAFIKEGNEKYGS